MAFSEIPPVETSDRFLDFAFKKANKVAEALRDSIKDTPKYKSKKIEIAKVETIEKVLNKHFLRIIKTFPDFENLTEFYEELLKTYINVAEVRKALGAIAWAKTKSSQFSKEFLKRLSGAQRSFDMNKLRRSYYGRISSVLKQVKTSLVFLEETRRVLKSFPTIKEGIFTVAIAGFPNVGKSTLLSKLTPATPEINSYAFTTRRLNLGYSKKGLLKIQYVDTPGTLDRFEKMNEIEMQAHLAIKYVSDLICYIFDLTEESAPLEEQFKLLKNLKRFDKTIICFISKKDLLSEEVISSFEERFSEKKIPLIKDLKELEVEIQKFGKESM